MAGTPEARVLEQGISGQHGLIVAVAEGHRVVGDLRHDDGKQQQHQDEAEGHHGALVGAEPDPGVAEIADGFGFEPLVVDAFLPLDKLEFFLRDGGNIDIYILFHHFFDPILMRGSISP